MTTIEAISKPIKDPQPSVDRIDDLAKRILTGDICLPKFQREFVWEKAQVIDLLDSVARNFPIGSVLLWQSKQELRSESKIADLEIALPKSACRQRPGADGGGRQLLDRSSRRHFAGNNRAPMARMAPAQE
jgi:Protein of unknown function DUF262